jgi:hypothetical protein
VAGKVQAKGIEQKKEQIKDIIIIGGWRGGGGAEWIPLTKCDAIARARRHNEEQGKTSMKVTDTTNEGIVLTLSCL